MSTLHSSGRYLQLLGRQSTGQRDLNNFTANLIPDGPLSKASIQHFL